MTTSQQAGDKAKAFFHHRTRFPRHPHLPLAKTRAHINNGVLHLYFRWLNNRWWAARWLTAACYLIGFVCLAIPSAGVFYRVMKIIFGVIRNDFGQSVLGSNGAYETV